jgi:predicted PurR-regulated permease PerM
LAAALVLGVMHFGRITGFAALLWSLVVPVFAGFAVTYVLSILQTRFESAYFPKSKKSIVKKTRKPVSVILAVLSALLVLVLVFFYALPKVVDALLTLASSIPAAVELVNGFIDEHRDEIPLIAERLGQVNIDWDGMSKTISNYALTGIGGLVNSAYGFASNVISGLFNLFMTISIAAHLMTGKEKLAGQLKLLQKAYMKEEYAQKLNYGLSVAHESFSDYIVGQCVEAFILGTLCALGMWVFRFPYASTIGVFVGVTALIPVVGAYIGAGTGALLILTVDPLKALFFIVYIIILQQLENNLIYPKIVGKSVGLPGIWVIISVIIGGGLFGIAGMMFSVPVTATVYKLVRADAKRRLG